MQELVGRISPPVGLAEHSPPGGVCMTSLVYFDVAIFNALERAEKQHLAGHPLTSCGELANLLQLPSHFRGLAPVVAEREKAFSHPANMRLDRAPLRPHLVNFGFLPRS